MAELDFVTLDVFTTTRFAGNPLAICLIPSGHDVSTGQMQKIAREFNLSETVFLHEEELARDGLPEWKVRIFMTAAELPFAGHPTIGSACYALGTIKNNADKGRLLCRSGPITIQYKNGKAEASIPHHFHLHSEFRFTENEVYELQPALKAEGCILQAIDVVSPVRGMNFICVQLLDLKALTLVELGKKPEALLDRDWNKGFVGSYFYVITKENLASDSDEIHIRARMIEGSIEDPATGSAACGLSSLLALKLTQKTSKFAITQGVEMGRKSDIGVQVTLKDDLKTVEAIQLSGSSVKVMRGKVHYD